MPFVLAEVRIIFQRKKPKAMRYYNITDRQTENGMIILESLDIIPVGSDQKPVYWFCICLRLAKGLNIKEVLSFVNLNRADIARNQKQFLAKEGKSECSFLFNDEEVLQVRKAIETLGWQLDVNGQARIVERLYVRTTPKLGIQLDDWKEFSCFLSQHD
jgi:hypothetical protein